MIRTATLTLAALALSTVAAAAAPAWTSTEVFFRDGPGIWHPVITQLPYCAAVDTSTYENGWARVMWEGRWGWVSMDYLTSAGEHCAPGYRSGASNSGSTNTYIRPRY